MKVFYPCLFTTKQELQLIQLLYKTKDHGFIIIDCDGPVVVPIYNFL